MELRVGFWTRALLHVTFTSYLIRQPDRTQLEFTTESVASRNLDQLTRPTKVLVELAKPTPDYRAHIMHAQTSALMSAASGPSWSAVSLSKYLK